MKPTVMKTGGLCPPVTMAVAVTEDGFDFVGIDNIDIIKLGLGSEQNLQKTLDGFLAKLNKDNALPVFELFDKLQKGVKDAKLDEIVKKIQQGPTVGLSTRILARFKGKNPQDVARAVLGDLKDLINSQTKTLSDYLAELEQKLKSEMAKLLSELKSLEELKQSYRKHLGDFEGDVQKAKELLEKARIYVGEESKKVPTDDVLGVTRIQELKDKLQLLESRVLALEGTYTRLPADHVVIQQIQQAGAATLQETATTLSARFTSIKMTLLAVNASFSVKSLQQISENHEKLDDQLVRARGRLLNNIVTTATNAPGDNRLKQAEQISKIIKETKEIQAIVEKARVDNETKFAAAREKFAEARKALAGKIIIASENN